MSSCFSPLSGDVLPQPPTVQDLAEELGRVRYERDLLLHQIQCLEQDIADARGPTAWRTLLTIARFVEDGGVGALNGRRP